MSLANITIVDYGVGNLFNLQRAFAAIGQDTRICTRPQEISLADKLILPGVGAFEAGAKALRETGLWEALGAAAQAGKPILGVCLGMQLLLSRSHENGVWEGLNLIPGEVVPLQPWSGHAKRYKIPHMGWSTLEPSDAKLQTNQLDPWASSFLRGIPIGAHMYFLHSYQVQPQDSQHAVAMTEYGSDRFCSVVQHGHIMGCQFHPERSAELGMVLLKNFVEFR